MDDFLRDLAKFVVDLRAYFRAPTKGSLKKSPLRTLPIRRSKAWSGGLPSERRAMYALALRICTEEGLTVRGRKPWGLGDDLLATVWGESGWNQWCENHGNRNGSVDYGIAQFNSRTYLKEYKMTPQEALENPEKCLRIMARNFKAKRAGNWFAYKSRSKYLGKTI